MATTSTPTPLLLTIPEAAAHLRIHRSTVYDLISDGALEAIDLARPGCTQTKLRVPYASLKTYIDKRPRVLAS